MLKQGDKGLPVLAVKAMLLYINGIAAEPNDDYGPVFASSVRAFQSKNGLTADGIIGAKTLQAIHEAFEQKLAADRAAPPKSATPPPVLTVVRADIWRDAQGNAGLERTSLRTDAAEAYNKVKEEINAYGALLTSAGGIRALNAPVTAGRSRTSLHYLGIAHDHALNSGMINPDKDPYVIERVPQPNGRTKYIVWARCDASKAELPLPSPFKPKNVVTYHSRVKAVPVKADHFINITDIWEKHGFSNIHAHTVFESNPKSSMTHSEWWHFQYDKKLVRGKTTFGEELRKLYAPSVIAASPLASVQDLVYGREWA